MEKILTSIFDIVGKFIQPSKVYILYFLIFSFTAPNIRILIDAWFLSVVHPFRPEKRKLRLIYPNASVSFDIYKISISHSDPYF